MTYIAVTLFIALFLDYILGEPARFHPLIGFGNLAKWVEQKMNLGNQYVQLCFGAIAWLILVLPLPILLVLFFVPKSTEISLFVDCIIIYWALGHKSLRIHGLQIFHALANKDLPLAQKFCGYIVSRETRSLTEQDICRATTESMLENGHDAVIATLFWYVVGGAPLVIVHRLANTLDAMWGYKNEQFTYFGRFSARADDILGYPSAKVSSILFAIQGIVNKQCWYILQQSHQQAKHYKSFNGGMVMSAGATLMNVKLGGNATYHGKEMHSPQLGHGDTPSVNHISASLTRVGIAAFIFISAVFIAECFIYYIG